MKKLIEDLRREARIGGHRQGTRDLMENAASELERLWKQSMPVQATVAIETEMMTRSDDG